MAVMRHAGRPAGPGRSPRLVQRFWRRGAMWLALAASASVLLAGPPARALEAYDAAEEAGIAEVTRTWSAAAHDADGDGD
jgi:hypothetical protein